MRPRLSRGTVNFGAATGREQAPLGLAQTLASDAPQPPVSYDGMSENPRPRRPVPSSSFAGKEEAAGQMVEDAALPTGGHGLIGPQGSAWGSGRSSRPQSTA